MACKKKKKEKGHKLSAEMQHPLKLDQSQPIRRKSVFWRN